MDIKGIFEEMSYGPAPESSTIAEEWLDSYNRQFELFIDGDWVKPNSGEYFSTINPSNKKSMAKIAEANKADVVKQFKTSYSASDKTYFGIQLNFRKRNNS